MKKILFLLCLLVTHGAFSQCIILDVKLNDCVSCRRNISVIKDLASQLPIYAVFSEKMRDDSLDLDYKLSLNNQKIKYLFNNKFYKKFHKADTSSNWYVLDQNGVTVMEGDLKTMDQDRLFDSVKRVVELLPTGNRIHFDFTEQRVFTYNSDINKVQILLKRDLRSVINIRPRDFDFKYLLSNLSREDSVAFVEKGLVLTTLAATGFKPGFTWIDINPSNELYAMLEYIQPFKKGEAFEYETETCLVKYDNDGNVKEVYPVNYDSVRKCDNYGTGFSFKNNDTFLAITHNPNGWFRSELNNGPDHKIEFVTDYTFDKADGTYKPVRHYPIDLPLIYREKYEENFLSPDLCSFPYIAFNYANELYDLNTNKSCHIIDQATYESHVDMVSKELGKEKYKVLSVARTVDGKGVLVVYKLEDRVYIKHFNEGLKATKIVRVDSVLERNNIDDCFIDPYSAQVYFTFEEEASAISLPLGLYGF